MKGVFGLLSLLVVVAALGLLAKRQLIGGQSRVVSVPDVAVSTPTTKSSGPAPTVREQSQQIQDQVKQAAQAGMQPRVVDDK